MMHTRSRVLGFSVATVPGGGTWVVGDIDKDGLIFPVIARRD
jgi:hypothetical protein